MANQDFTKDPDNILLDLINVDNPGHTFTVAEVTLAVPTVVTTGSETDPSWLNRKSRLTVSAANGSGYADSVDVFYNRVAYRDVLTTTEADTVKYPVATETFDLLDRVNLSDLLTEINTRHALNIQPDDFWDMPLPTFTGLPPYDDAFVKLEAKTSSKIFIGGVQLKINPNPFDLANMPVTTLQGLVYPTWQVRAVNFVNGTMSGGGAGVAFW